MPAPGSASAFHGRRYQSRRLHVSAGEEDNEAPEPQRGVGSRETSAPLPPRELWPGEVLR